MDKILVYIILRTFMGKHDSPYNLCRMAQVNTPSLWRNIISFSLGLVSLLNIFFALNTNKSLEFWVMFLQMGLEHGLKHHSSSCHTSGGNQCPLH